MNFLDALRLCRDNGCRVRPVSWRNINPGHWIEYRQRIFVEHGECEEIPHVLRLMHPEEFLGEWEEVKG